MNRPTRILTAILASLVIGGMFAYQDAQKNAPTYQQHPVTVILTDFFGASLSGLIFYFGSGWLARRKERKLEKAGDVKFYDEVARELQDKPLAPGLWTKAFAETGGDDAKARALYIKYRVTQLAEARRQQRPENQKYSRTTQVVFAATIFAVVVLIVIPAIMTSNKSVQYNTVANDANTSAATKTEQLPNIQIATDSDFDRQKKLAEKGDAAAQAKLGVCYYKGWGVKQDYGEAVKWFGMAADQGNAEAQNNLAYFYSIVKNTQKLPNGIVSQQIKTMCRLN